MADRLPTLHIPSLTGAWKDVFAHRERFHQTAEAAVLEAWRVCVADTDIDAAAAAAVQSLIGRTFEADVSGTPGTPGGRRRRLDVLAATLAAILYRMAHGAPWEALRRVLADQLTQAWEAGWNASQTVTSDETEYDADADMQPAPVMTSVADTVLQTASRWIISGAAKTAAAVLVGTSSAGGARSRIARALRAFLKAPMGLRLALDHALAAAYSDGMTAHQQGAGSGMTAWVTAGDDRVCDTCMKAEENGPYPYGEGPRPPAHPVCRCIPMPA